MGKVIVTISELTLGKNFETFQILRKWNLGWEKGFFWKTFKTKINVQEFFFDDSYSEQVKDFWQMVGKFIPNSHEKFRICQFEHIKVAF